MIRDDCVARNVNGWMKGTNSVRYAACTSKTTTLVLGDATPYQPPSTLSPDVGAPAMCGYNGDTPEVGCDAIVGKEYISVRSNTAGLSTADA